MDATVGAVRIEASVLAVEVRFVENGEVVASKTYLLRPGSAWSSLDAVKADAALEQVRLETPVEVKPEKEPSAETLKALGECQKVVGQSVDALPALAVAVGVSDVVNDGRV